MGIEADGRTGGRANIVVGAAIAVVVVAAIAVMVLMRLGAPADAGGLRAIVHDGDGADHEISLSEDSETTIETSLGTNVVTVRDGAVFVSDADCDNHDCIRQGSIDAPGKQVICLPHKLWIEVVAEGGGSGQMRVDAVANGGEGSDVAGGEASDGDGGSGFDVVAR